MVLKKDIDISENSLRSRDDLLNILLKDHTTKKNIIWATDSYLSRGKEFAPKKQMYPELVTGLYGKLIQPRAVKSLEEQKQRTKDKAEVFTPKKIVKQMNKLVDSAIDYPIDKNNWKRYVQELKLEITCGEAPFICSRYNPTSHTGKKLKIKHRVGFLDKKLRIVSKYCDSQDEWFYWAREAYKSSYGYEWQGDNVLIARENLLYTFIDFYKYKFKRYPALQFEEEIAKIISWNIWQMDGLKYVIPMSCKHVSRVIRGDLTLFGETPDTIEKDECEGCKYNRITKHNGKYSKIMDWSINKPIYFVDLLSEK
jgi:hypothetical protein